MRYRKEDLGKIALLSVLIVAAVGFSLYTVRGARHTPRAAATRPTATTGPAAAESKTAELFAARSTATAGLVAHAQETNDPFRPSASARTRAGVPLPPVKPPVPLPGTPPFRAQTAVARPEEPAFRLFGLVSGSAPVAAIEYAQHRYFAHAGEALPDGWQVTRIADGRVTLSKGRQQVTLRLSVPEDRETRPLGVR